MEEKDNEIYGKCLCDFDTCWQKNFRASAYYHKRGCKEGTLGK